MVNIVVDINTVGHNKGTEVGEDISEELWDEKFQVYRDYQTGP